MLKEEKEFRKFVRGMVVASESCGEGITIEDKEMYKLIRSLVRAVREDCAKVAEFGRCGIEPMDNPRDRVVRDGIAAAIRGKK